MTSSEFQSFSGPLRRWICGEESPRGSASRMVHILRQEYSWVSKQGFERAWGCLGIGCSLHRYPRLWYREFGSWISLSRSTFWPSGCMTWSSQTFMVESTGIGLWFRKVIWILWSWILMFCWLKFFCFSWFRKADLIFAWKWVHVSWCEDICFTDDQDCSDPLESWKIYPPYLMSFPLKLVLFSLTELGYIGSWDFW